MIPARVTLSMVVFLSAAMAEAQNWPSFRGENASGISDGQRLPLHWDGTSLSNILWKTPIPGLAHSSPVVWGDRVYLITATRVVGESPTNVGNLSGALLAEDNGEAHSWELLAIDKKTGAIAWRKKVHQGVPRVKRHMKASHASATPATDGRRLVASFGSEGLYCFDMQGEVLWKRDLGVLDAGYLARPELQWGPASSPIIYKDMVVVQSDNHADSSLIALNLEDGRVIWRTDRKERPAWSTPVIFRGDRVELITNGGLFLRAYDPDQGKELWRFRNDSEVIVPTPVVGDGIVILTGGAPRNARPLFAIRPGGQGDITPTTDALGSRFLAWQVDRASTYVPTPIIYRGVLYVCEDNGILGAYEPSTGKSYYKARLQGVAGFSGSPVASDGRLYFPSEDGDVVVVRAGREFELLAVNPMGEALMATPALSDQLLIVRGRHHLFAVGTKPPAPSGAGQSGR